LVFGGFTGLSFIDRLNLYLFGFYLPLLDYDFSLHKVIQIFVSFKTSPRSSKTESGCSSYCRFRFGVSASFGGPEKAGPGPEKAGPWHI
jgi:hypothetical protein